MLKKFLCLSTLTLCLSLLCAPLSASKSNDISWKAFIDSVASEATIDWIQENPVQTIIALAKKNPEILLIGGTFVAALGAYIAHEGITSKTAKTIVGSALIGIGACLILITVGANLKK